MRSWGVFFLFFFIAVCDDREINGVTLLTQVHIPTQSLKWRLLGGKKPKWVFVWLTVQSLAWRQICICRFLGGFDGSETVNPPRFLQGVLGFCFLVSDSVCCNSYLQCFGYVVWSNPLSTCQVFSWNLLLFLHWVSLDISKQLRGPQTSPAVRLITALLFSVNSWAWYRLVEIVLLDFVVYLEAFCWEKGILGSLMRYQPKHSLTPHCHQSLEGYFLLKDTDVYLLIWERTHIFPTQLQYSIIFLFYINTFSTVCCSVETRTNFH